jgi:hypothetical protein
MHFCRHSTPLWSAAILPMKKYLLPALFISLITVSCNQKDTVENTIFCSVFKTDPLSSAPGSMVGSQVSVNVALPTAWFGKKFWVYLQEKYPDCTGIIFNPERKESWATRRYYQSTEPKIDTSKTYFSKRLDIPTRLRLAKMLGKNESRDPSVYKNFSKFKRLLADTAFAGMEIFCEKETLQLIQNRQYNF